MSIGFLRVFLFLVACSAGHLAGAQANDPFKDVDVIAPFEGRPLSSTYTNIDDGFAKELFFMASEMFLDVERGSCVRARGWYEKAEEGNPPQVERQSSWDSHGVCYGVVKFSSATAAEKALAAIFSEKFAQAEEARLRKHNEDHRRRAAEWAAMNSYTREVPPGVIGKPGYEPGAWPTSKHTTGYYVQKSAEIPEAMHWEREHYNLLGDNKKSLSGSAEKGGKWTITETMSGEMMTWRGKWGFARRGAYVLVARVDVAASQRQKMVGKRVLSLIVESIPYPDDIWNTVATILKNAHQGRPFQSPPETEDEEGIPLEVKVYAKGHQPASEYFRTDVDPSEIVISGNVRDQYGNAVNQARVVLVEKNKETKTLANGTYVLRASHDGDTPYETTLDFMLLKQSSGLTATWESPLNITANSGESTVVLELADDNGPVRNQEVDIGGTQGFRREGKPIDYVWDGGGNSRRLTTDQRGRLTFKLRHPDSVKQLPGNLTGDTAFPLIGALKVRVLESNTSTVAEYAVNSPFPEVSGMETGRFLEAGQWQIDPSRISIKDRDSDTFIITLEGPGAFKALGDTASQGTGHPRYLSQDIEGKTFRFHYKPKYQGFDLNNQPKVWKEIAELGGKVYLSVLTNVGGGKMLDKVALYYPGQSVTRAFLINDKGVVSAMYITGKLQKASGFAKKSLKGASHVSNFSNIAFNGYANQDAIVKTLTGQGSTEDLIVTTDNAIGLVDTGLGFTKLTPVGAAYWEALKASWEADKVAYKISKQYYDIAEAYQDITSEEVIVTVEDETGRKAQAVGAFKVLVWKGGA